MFYRMVAVCMALGLSQSALALDENIYLHGTLVEEPCSLSMTSVRQTVKLGNVIKNTLYLHQRTHSYPFTLVLEECDISLGTIVEIGFNGVADELQPDRLAVSGTAKGIAIGLETAEGKPLILNKTIERYGLNDGRRVLAFAAYVSAPASVIENQGIVEGDFSASATFTLNYP
ncbi:fimbrial protein [Serratia marcescens]|uniref:fimbrial protein n=1 Tax=Serratia marcescens TaxID=615 RepID=UPI00301C378B